MTVYLSKDAIAQMDDDARHDAMIVLRQRFFKAQGIEARQRRDGATRLDPKGKSPSRKGAPK